MAGLAYSPIIWPLFISFAISLVLIVTAWEHQQVTGARPFGLLVLTCAIWLCCYTLEISSVDPAAKAFWLRVKYFGVAHLPLFYLMFALEYGGQGQWLTRRNLLLVESVALFNLTMALTNPLHNLFWTEIWVGADGIQRVTQGPLFWIMILFNYSLFVGGMVALFLTWRRAELLYRRQIGLVLVGAMIPLLGNGLTITDLSPIPQYDLTPFGFTITGIAVGWSLFRFQLLNIVPVAHAAIFKSIQEGVIVLDLQNRVVAFNPAAQAIMGMTATQVIGNPAREVFQSWPQLLDQYHDRVSVITEIAVGEGEAARNFELRISPLYDGRQSYSGRMIVLHDITERIRTLAERDRLIQELDAFAHTVAHDLKNPLGVVKNYAELLQMGHYASNETRRAEVLQTITRSAVNMHSIIDELLLLSTIRQEQVPYGPVYMDQVFINAHDRLAGLIEQRAPEFVLPEGWPVAQGYQPWVVEVLTNYLSNAIKYGGEPPRVELGAEVIGSDSIRVWVRDNGPGIAPENHDVIFDQFTRLDVGRVEGHGLGLSIVKRIVDKLGGEVGIESENGQGATFSFTLPLYEQALSCSPPHQAAAHPVE